MQDLVRRERDAVGVPGRPVCDSPRNVCSLFDEKTTEGPIEELEV